MNYTTARESLNQAFKRYIAHKKNQLSTLAAESPMIPTSMFYERALGTEEPSPGFTSWVSCKYAYLFDEIAELNRVEDFRDTGTAYYEENYLPSRGKTNFYCELRFRGEVAPRLNSPRLLDRLNLLVGLVLFIMIDENKEQDFELRWNEYNNKNGGNYVCLDNDPVSVNIHKELMKLQSLISFIDTLPEYRFKNGYLLKYLNDSLPTFESYRKYLAVQELKEILDDVSLNDEDAVKKVALQLKNPITVELLEKNQQSDTEYMLKVLSLVLVAVLIGVIPTICLASKRLYDTGGSSINFFKPLSKNLCEDVENITADISPSSSQ